MSAIEFKANFRVSHSNLITKKNMSRIRVYSSRVCDNVIHPRIDNKSYFETYVVKKDPKGYIFQEVTHGMGISGYHKTLRELIISACLSPHLRVCVELDAAVPQSN